MNIERFSNLNYKYGTRQFWCKGSFVSTVGVDEATIVTYIHEQKEREKIFDQHGLIKCSSSDLI